MTDEAKPKKRGKVTRKEWIKAVYDIKYSAYHDLYCGEESLRACHSRVLKLLEENPRLAKSEYGRNYIEKTKGVGKLLDAMGALECSIEDILVDGFGALSLKYWDPARLPRAVRKAMAEIRDEDEGSP